MQSRGLLHFYLGEAGYNVLELQTFRPSTSEGLSGVTLKARAKQTWDLWPAIYAVVQRRNTVNVEKHLAHHLNDIHNLMKLHTLEDAHKAQWLNAEINFLTLYSRARFPQTPKFHMLQHIYTQFENDCSPRCDPFHLQ